MEIPNLSGREIQGTACGSSSGMGWMAVQSVLSAEFPEQEEGE